MGLIFTAWRYPTFADQGAAGEAGWDEVDWVLGEPDGSAAFAPQILPGGINTKPLNVYSFGFNIPATATLLGITARVRRKQTGTLVTSSVIRLLVGGTNTGDDKTDSGAAWATDWETKIYGGPADDWGGLISVAELNDDNPATGFGMRIRATKDAADRAHVDSVQIGVTYDYDPAAAYGGKFMDTSADLIQFGGRRRAFRRGRRRR